MNKKIKNICVFASSSNEISQEFYNLAYNLGKVIAQAGYNIVYGGSNRGLMGEVTSSARTYGAEAIGIMPQRLYDLGIESGNCTKFILTKGMRERKAKMDELSQAIIALPGGFGTLEELSEMIVQKQLGYNNKPIVILDCNNYYNNLIKFFNDIIRNNLAPCSTKEIYHVTDCANNAIEYINNYSYPVIQYLDEKLAINK